MQLIGCMNPESFAEFCKSPGNFATLTSNRDGYKNKQYGEKTGWVMQSHKRLKEGQKTSR